MLQIFLLHTKWSQTLGPFRISQQYFIIDYRCFQLLDYRGCCRFGRFDLRLDYSLPYTLTSFQRKLKFLQNTMKTITGGYEKDIIKKGKISNMKFFI
jgi:hypothetical protein